MADSLDRWPEIESLFRDLVEQPPDSWTWRLDQACGDDPELRAMVMSLLEEDDRPHDVLARLNPQVGSFPPLQVREAGAPATASKPVSIGRYLVLDELGRGGMGIVYLAEDRQLGRRLAIKVLPPEWRDRSHHIRRLEREARMLAALHHPNIATLHSLERDGETRFLTMELVDGVALSTLITDGHLDVDRAFTVCEQITAALEVAHARSIIHRDLKPANVMVDSDHRVKVLDFGLAKMLTTPAPGVDKPLSVTTGIDHCHGTPGYMSPEQIRGWPADERSDIWMFGCILFECLARRPAFPGTSAADRVVATLHDTPDWSALPIIPMPAFQLLETCLARMPDERPESMAAIHRTLQSVCRPKRLAVEREFDACVVHASRPPAPVHDKITSTPSTDAPSLAVLPFVDLSRRHDQEHFCDGLAEELINIMNRTPGLRVLARTSSFAFKGQTMDAREVGARLNVQVVLEGSARSDDRRLLIDAGLVDVRSGDRIWSDRYDCEMGDVFGVQAEIASAIASALELELLKPITRTHGRQVTPDAYTRYLRGQFFVNRATQADYERAVSHFEETIDLVPEYAPAHVGLANAYNMLAIFYYRPEFFQRAKAAAEMAVDLDPGLASGFTALGVATWVGDWDWDAGHRHLRRAMAINPAYSTGYSHLGSFYMSAARYTDALVSYQNALDLDPLYVFASVHLGCLYIRTNQIRNAQRQLMRALEMSPQIPTARWVLGQTYVLENRCDEGIRELEDAAHVCGRLPTILSTLGWAYARTGRVEAAHEILDELRSRSGVECVGPYCLAKVEAGLSNHDAALGHLENAWRNHDYVWMAPVLTDETWRPLRHHPRYLDLIDRMGLRTFWDQRDWPEEGLVEGFTGPRPSVGAQSGWHPDR